jgi:hypothetical protein
MWILFQKTLKKIYRPLSIIETYNKNDFTFITYNIQKFPVPFKSFEPIKKLITQYSMVLLQECYDELFSSLETYFPNHYICRGTLTGINIMNSGLVILSVYPILETTFTCFKNTNSLTLDAFAEKGYLSALIDISGQKIMVVNTHLQSCDYEEYDPIALLQLEELIDFSRYIKYPYIIGGDFNIDIKECKKRYPTLDVNYPIEPTIYINFKNGHSKCSASTNYTGLIFDYFIKGGLIYDMYVETKCYNDYSDHNPVISKLCM